MALSHLRVYRFRPTPEEQVWQRLPAGDEGAAPCPGGAAARGNAEAAPVPPGCVAGEVNTGVAFVFLLC